MEFVRKVSVVVLWSLNNQILDSLMMSNPGRWFTDQRDVNQSRFEGKVLVNGRKGGRIEGRCRGRGRMHACGITAMASAIGAQCPLKERNIAAGRCGEGISKRVGNRGER